MRTGWRSKDVRCHGEEASHPGFGGGDCLQKHSHKKDGLCCMSHFFMDLKGVFCFLKQKKT